MINKLVCVLGPLHGQAIAPQTGTVQYSIPIDLDNMEVTSVTYDTGMYFQRRLALPFFMEGWVLKQDDAKRWWSVGDILVRYQDIAAVEQRLTEVSDEIARVSSLLRGE